ncbi:MAG: AAA family ATPase, partial [Anaerolineae bacterium]|nr:AAA family ATPase [Anaerolineae bacterium]
PPDDYGLINVTTDVAEESIQRRAVLYDKDGDAHFDTISAFIKSLRGSDPDAALYWLAKMVYAGEDARFIFRRMLIFAGEDVGMADPQAVTVVAAAAQAFDYVGMPEGRFHLGLACLYLATAPKSNSVMAFFDALAAVEREREADVPSHLRDANRDGADFGHGAGYLYPHAYQDHWVAQQYLPPSLQGRLFYQPSAQGHEGTIRDLVARRREEQLAALVEPHASLDWEVERMGKGPAAQNPWLQRTLSGVGAQLGQIRDRIFALAQIERHNLVLDLNVGTGLLTWEAVRRSAAGGVYALAADRSTTEVLNQQANNLQSLERPVVLTGRVVDLPQLITAAFEAPQQQAWPRFDVVIGRNVLTQLKDKTAAANAMQTMLKPGGRVVLAEIIPKYTQRLHKLVDLSTLPLDLIERISAAEEAIYTNPDDAMVNWDEESLRSIFEQVGFSQIELYVETTTAEWRIDMGQIERWFNIDAQGKRPTFAQFLSTPKISSGLSLSELGRLKTLFQQQLADTVVVWQSTVAYIVGNQPID